MAGITGAERRRRLGEDLARRTLPCETADHRNRVHAQLDAKHSRMLREIVERLRSLAQPRAVITRSHAVRYAIELLHRDLIGPAAGEELQDAGVHADLPPLHNGTGAA